MWLVTVTDFVDSYDVDCGPVLMNKCMWSTFVSTSKSTQFGDTLTF